MKRQVKILIMKTLAVFALVCAMMPWLELLVNVWTWSDGTPFHYKDWCDGEPNNPGRQRCLQMNHSEDKCWDNSIVARSCRPSVSRDPEGV
ncbi:hypothetical protein F7725_021199 [Dissostichus mawsoni]|uniref:C-type lectin domain-containing protein n=1 Tax=Dissostichus mawsoni TaxID=36200 RepID=A0A7J5YGT0_DISMA|nr:hypothetical protein F7725_021199 [Dissostichus mawsoni]